MKLLRKLLTWRKDTKGVAILEFALVMPFLALLLVGSAEVVALTWASGRVQDAVSAAGDLTAQNTSMNENLAGAIMQAGDSIMELNAGANHKAQNFTLTLTSALACPCSEGSSEFCYTVLWSHQSTGGALSAGYTPGSLLSFVPTGLSLGENDTLIVAEADYTYAPAFQFILPSSLNSIEETGYHRPRLSGRVVHIGDQKLDPEPRCDTLDEAFGGQSG